MRTVDSDDMPPRFAITPRDGRGTAGAAEPWRIGFCRTPELVPRPETGGAVEIFVQRKQRIWLQFPERAAEFLFDPIDSMEEISPVDV